jgi:hypothetical protein
MAGLVPAIHDLLSESKEDVDARHKAGHDAEGLVQISLIQRLDAHDLSFVIGVPDRHWIG